MAEKISVQIALEGAAEVKSELAGISQAGQKCFEDIASAAEKAGGFAKLDPTLVAQKFQQFGITAKGEIDKITGAIQTAGKFEGLVTGVEKVEQNFKSASTTVGTFGNVASSVFNSLETALNRLEKTAARALGPLSGAVRAFGPFGLAAVAVGAVTVAFERFAVAAGETEKTLNDLQKVSGQSFENLSALAIVFREGGTPVKQFAAELGNLSEKIAAAGQAAKIREADQEWVKWANDIGAVRQQFDNLGRGGGATFSALTTLDTKVKALLESLAKVRDPQEQFNKLADIFKNLGTDLERAQIGKALGLSPDTIQTLSRGSELLRQMAQEVKNLGLVSSDLDKINLQGFISAQERVGALFTALRDKLGALAAPAFTGFFKGIGDEIARLAPNLQDMAKAFGEIDLTEFGRSLVRAGVAVADFVTNLAKAIGGNVEAKKKVKDQLNEMLDSIINTIIPKAIDLGVKIGEAIFKGLNDATTKGVQDFFKNTPIITLKFDPELAKKNIDSMLELLKKGLAITPAGAAEAPGGASPFASMEESAARTVDQIRILFANIGETIGAALKGADFTTLFAPLTDAAQKAVNDISLLFSTFGQSLAAGFQGVNFSGVFQPLLDAAQQAVNQISQLFITLGQSLATAFDFSSLIAQIDTATAAFNRMAAAATGAANAASGLGSGSQSVPGLEPSGLAGGGLLGGRGTGTSDSNLIWASRGEHIMPARAVAQPGVLEFLEALRRSGGNLRSVLDGMGRFAVGGLIMPRIMPAFATGGLVGGGHPVTINFPGVGPISGLRASADTVAELQRAAAMAQVRSGGRKPSRYS